jgi:hypothetical protein
MDSLGSKHNLGMVLKAIQNLPEGVNATYDEAMDRISKQDSDYEKLANDVLSWISHAKRPLRVAELQHALAIEENTTEFSEDYLTSEDNFVSVCAGLVVIDSKSNIIRLTRKYHIVSPYEI